VPEGFEIKLVAEAPAVLYPCQVATAPDGSLFVGEDPMDQVGPADKPIDRILLFRIGKEPVVFAEKLNAIFGMVWHDGSLFVMNMPNLTVLRDTDGDGKADHREELFTDLGVHAGQPNLFNDHIVSGIQVGIDGYLYISVGDKGVPKATGRDGRTAQMIGGGTLRCRLDGTGLEVFSTGTRNHLEPNLDERDNLFTYDNTDDGLGWWTRVTHHVDGGYYGYPWDYDDRTDRMLDRMAEYGGGSPCGGFVYKEDVWPEKYRGRGFWAEWGKRTVRGFSFKPEGASFKVAEDIDFVEHGDVSDFRPLDLALSYDGRTMYVADWASGSWLTKTERVGRVYAVTYKGDGKTRPRGKDSDAIEAQIKQLDHPSFNERFRAQTALSKQGRKALWDVTAALADPRTDALAKRHLVWAIDAIAGGTPEATIPLIEALKAREADVRAQAARALGERAVPIAREALVALLVDREPSVRLQAIIALGRIGDHDAVPALLPLVAEKDRYLAFSARKALARIGDWAAVAAGLDSVDPNIRAGVLLALEGVYDTDAVAALAKFAADPIREASERARALEFLAQGHRKTKPWDGKWWGTQPAGSNPSAKSVDWEGTPLVLSSIRARLSDSSPPVRVAAVSAVLETRDTLSLPALRALFTKDADASVRRQVARVLGAIGDRTALPLLIAAIRDETNPEVVRDAAVGSVEVIGTDVALTGLLDLLESGKLSAEKVPRVIAALGRFKSNDSAKALLKALKNPAPCVRAAAAEAIGKVGRAETAGKPLVALLADGALDVRNAAASALGALRVRDAVPALIEAAGSGDTRFEASQALAAMPDLRALPIFLHSLADRSPELRRSSAVAISRIRDEAVPVLERLAVRKELPSAALPELRRIYSSVRPIMNWHVLGPLPIKTDAPFTLGEAVDLKTTYPGYEAEPIAWKPAHAKDEKGEVDLGEVFKNGVNVAAYAYAEVESPLVRRAQLAVGSDDTLTVWVNGEQVYDFQDRRSFDPETAHASAPLVKGKNRVVVKCGNIGGAWQFSVAMTSPSDYAFLNGPAPGAFDPESYREFAQAARGRPDRGRSLFADTKGLACLKCHSVAGQGGTVGPELSSVGAKYPKDELIASVLYPSAKISSGYEPVVIAIDDGRVITGIIKGETAEAIDLDDSDAKRQRIDKTSIEERKRSDVSLMPNGLAEGLTREDFADLISYLESLKDAGPSPKAAAGGGR
jgi:putative membrane-bound dehydrogenase-like protein